MAADLISLPWDKRISDDNIKEQINILLQASFSLVSLANYYNGATKRRVKSIQVYNCLLKHLQVYPFSRMVVREWVEKT